MKYKHLVSAPLWGLLVLNLGCGGTGDDDTPTGESPTDNPAATEPEVTEVPTPTPGEEATDTPEITTDTPEPTPPLTSDGGHPDGWTEDSHGKVDPNYDVVFPVDKVQRLDVTLTPEVWEAMLAEATELLGEFGAGGGGIPGANTASCEDLSAGDTCEVSEGVEGECTKGPGGTLMCIEPATEAQLAACEGATGGSECTYTDESGAEISGMCQGPPGQLACMGMPGGGGGGGDGSLYEGDFTFHPGTLTLGGIAWNKVGIRFKGNSSLSSAWSSGVLKLPFKLDFDEFEDDFPAIEDQRFYGFKHLMMSNVWGDPSFSREVLFGEILRAAGLPGARATFYELYIDVGEGPIYFGLYVVNEPIESTFLDSWLGEHEGNLYEPEGTCANFTCFSETDFAKENNESADDWSDVEAAVAALNGSQSDPSAWRESLDTTFDTEQFIHWLALNTLLVNWDSYGALAHNYYLYGDPAMGGALRWIPWDHNLSMMDSMMGGESLTIGLDEVEDSWPLIRYLMDDEVYRAEYDAEIERLLEEVLKVDTLQTRAEVLHELVSPYVVGAGGEVAPYTNLTSQQQFEQSLTTLQLHLAGRYDAGIEYLEGR